MRKLNNTMGFYGVLGYLDDVWAKFCDYVELKELDRKLRRDNKKWNKLSTVLYNITTAFSEGSHPSNDEMMAPFRKPFRGRLARVTDSGNSYYLPEGVINPDEVYPLPQISKR